MTPIAAIKVPVVDNAYVSPKLDYVVFVTGYFPLSRAGRQCDELTM
jgi:hypothetical protein